MDAKFKAWWDSMGLTRMAMVNARPRCSEFVPHQWKRSDVIFNGPSGPKHLYECPHCRRSRLPISTHNSYSANHIHAYGQGPQSLC